MELLSKTKIPQKVRSNDLLCCVDLYTDRLCHPQTPAPLYQQP